MKQLGSRPDGIISLPSGAEEEGKAVLLMAERALDDLSELLHRNYRVFC